MVILENNVKCLGNDCLYGQQISALSIAWGNGKRPMCNSPCKSQDVARTNFSQFLSGRKNTFVLLYK